MRQFALPRPFYYLSQNPPIDLSDLASERLRWLKTWQRLRQEGYTADRAAELLKLPRSTLYRWKKRLEAEGVRGLEDRSRRPKNCRRPQWSPELAQAVQDLREEYGWDKVKLAHMLKQEGWQTSASTVGRILTRLKARGVLREPLSNGIIPFSQWDQAPPPPCQACLRHPQTQRLHSEPAGGPGPGGHTGRAPPAGEGDQAVHRQGHGLTLGCDRSLPQRHRPQRQLVSRHPHRAVSLPGEGRPG